MTRGQRLKAIRTIYAELPKIDCQKLCARACGPIAMSEMEREVIETRVGRAVTTRVHPVLGVGTCSMLSAGCKCQVYGNRPTLCRLYGVAEGLECPWGCVPERLLTKDEARDVLLRVMELGGRPDLRGLQQQVQTYINRREA